MADLIAWLDAQKRKPFSRVDSIDKNLEAFDPLHRGRHADDFTIPARIVAIYDRGQQGMEGEVLGYEEPENGVLQMTLQNLLCLK